MSKKIKDELAATRLQLSKARDAVRATEAAVGRLEDALEEREVVVAATLHDVRDHLLGNAPKVPN
jgi:hypothetical protein